MAVLNTQGNHDTGLNRKDDGRRDDGQRCQGNPEILIVKRSPRQKAISEENVQGDEADDRHAQKNRGQADVRAVEPFHKRVLKDVSKSHFIHFPP